jgi:hypothetical protein
VNALESKFKRVKGVGESFESICMDCLLTAGICRSEEELAAREHQHKCGGVADLLRFRQTVEQDA